MKSKRSQLLEEMIAFFQQESGVVIGDPGVGKSYILSEMVTALLAEQIPSTMVRMDFLTDGTDAAIATELGMEGADWIAQLQKITLHDGKKGVLIFDAFDSVKDEGLKAILLNQIAKAKRELSNWSMVVSVRTYDASKSPKLIDLFPVEYNPDKIYCRWFSIPILSEEEVGVFLDGNDKLLAVYQGGTQKLRDILKIPFFLSLMDTILKKTETDTEALRILKSEIELLEMYWVKVVYKATPTTQTELFLRNLTKKMVEDRVLSVDKLEYLEDLSTQKVLIAEQLLSENVLTEQRSYISRIGYGHNILFDYAVSKLVLKDSAQALLSFITEDQARLFFLRPSFIYFFARLWYIDEAKFQEIYNELSKSVDPITYLFNKLIPSAVIAKEFIDTAQLKFLTGTEEFKQVQKANLLQAIRFLKVSGNIQAQVSLIAKLSETLELRFVSDFAFILEQLVENPIVREDDKLLKKCGLAARNLLGFLMLHSENPYVDQLAATRAVPMVAKTYSTHIEESRNHLQIVLDLLDKPGFNIFYFSGLTEQLKVFYHLDPDFCAAIYKRVFLHEENSTEPELMHSSTLMSFSSSRYDQFGTCRTRLREFFPTFLKAYPELGIRLGLDITNEFIDGRNQKGIVIPDSIDLSGEFTIYEVKAMFRVDMSHFWSELTTGNDFCVHTQFIIDYFKQLAENNAIELLNSGLKHYLAHARNAYNWKMLLELGAQHSKLLSNALFDLLLQPAILFWNDTIVAAGEFLESAAPLFNDHEILRIEQAILSIPDYVGVDEMQKVEATVLRLLSRIPRKRLKETKSLDLMASTDPVPNEELVQFESFSGPLTTEIFLAEKGIDVESPEIKTLIAESNRMESFSRQFQNEIVDRKIYEGPMRIALQTFETVKDKHELPPELVQTLLRNVASVCCIVLSSEMQIRDENPLSPDQYASIKEIILYCLAQHTESDSYAEENSSPATGYSSTPRTESADALPILFGLTHDPELLPLIKKFATDKNAVTRFRILQSLYILYPAQKTTFWEIIHERLAGETDWFTKAAVVRNLHGTKLLMNEPDEFLKAYNLAKQHVFTVPDGDFTFLSDFLSQSIIIFKETNDIRILDILRECLDQNFHIATTLVFEAFKIIRPENFYRNYQVPADVEKSQQVVDILSDVLERCERILLSVSPNDSPRKDVEIAFKIIDEVISRIYFSMQVNKRILDKRGIKISPDDQERFYFFIKPLLEKIIRISRQLDGGFMQGHSAHHFIEIMDASLRYDSRFSLATTSEITAMAARSSYTFDRSALNAIVAYTEKLLADHKTMLSEPETFGQIMSILDIYVQSGWPEALELLWRLDDIFR